MALMLSKKKGRANVVNLGELTFTQLNDPVSGLVSTYHKASVSTGLTGYNKIAIVSSSYFEAYSTGGAGVSVTDFSISIDETTGLATVSTTGNRGFIASYEPKLTVVVWSE